MTHQPLTNRPRGGRGHTLENHRGSQTLEDLLARVHDEGPSNYFLSREHEDDGVDCFPCHLSCLFMQTPNALGTKTNISGHVATATGGAMDHETLISIFVVVNLSSSQDYMYITLTS